MARTFSAYLPEETFKADVYDVCDDCTTAAYDLGISDYEGQVFICTETPELLDDHTCIRYEGEGDSCDCGCGNG